MANEIFETYYDKNHPELPVLSANQEYGMIVRDDVGYSVQHDKANEVTYKRVLPGQFVIHLRSFQGGFAHSAIEGITSPAYTILTFKNPSEEHDMFWRYLLTSKAFIKSLEKVTYGIRDGRTISYEDFSELKLCRPAKEEQVHIANLFQKLDSIITANDKKLSKIRNTKQALLQKMFV